MSSNANTLKAPMTREQAEELVEELLAAVHDYEVLGGKSYRDQFMEQRAKVIEALVEPNR